MVELLAGVILCGIGYVALLLILGALGEVWGQITEHHARRRLRGSSDRARKKS
jgi:Na+-translocating ferredoxin:NAD+ oxidoreductase RnfE subunit